MHCDIQRWGTDKYKDDNYFNVLEIQCTASDVQRTLWPPAAYPIVL
jgi:hypothetical protein